MLLTEIVLLLGFSWLLYRVISFITRKSPFSNIPGPPSPSWFAGESYLLNVSPLRADPVCTGNMFQYLNRHALDFHDEIIEKYGPVCVLNSILGVSFTEGPRRVAFSVLTLY